MTQNSDQSRSSGGGTKETAQQTKDQAKREAAQLGDEAQGAVRDVADTAKAEAGNVKDEALGQAKGLAESAKDEASSQLSTQQNRLAEQSRTVSDDLQRISRGEKPESELVNQAVSTLSTKARHFTEQLENREPADLLEDVRRFAARRPLAFLAIAAGVGLVAGRLTRGIRDAQSDDDGQDHGRQDHGGNERAAGPSGQDRSGRYIEGEQAPYLPAAPAQPPTVTGQTGGGLTTGAPPTEVLGTPAASDPYGTGRPGTGGRP